MKRQLITTLILGSAITLSSSFAVAAEDRLPTNSVPMSKVLRNLQEQGYSVVLKVELDNGMYDAKVMDAKGKELKINVAPQTGEVIKPKAQTARLTMMEAVKKAEEAGYKGIYRVTTSQNEYEMKGYDKDSKKVSLNVDATTGKINKEWF